MEMTWVISAMLIVAAGLFLVGRRFEKRIARQTIFPYQRAEALFTPAERSFFGALHQAFGKNAAIFVKVPAADILAPAPGLDRSARQKALKRVAGIHFDFIICDHKQLSVIWDFDLDDESRDPRKRYEQKECLKGACEAAGIRLIQVPAKPIYAMEDVKRLLTPGLSPKDTPYKETLKTDRRSNRKAASKSAQTVRPYPPSAPPVTSFADHIPAFFNVVVDVYGFDGSKSSLSKVVAGHFLAPHRAQPLPALGQRYGHAVHRRNGV
jgi:hypothetical protein